MLIKGTSMILEPSTLRVEEAYAPSGALAEKAAAGAENPKSMRAGEALVALA